MRTLLALSLLLAAAPLRGEENPGVTGAAILQVPMGSRAMGMGAAHSAVASDLSALYYNPAALSLLSYREASFMYLKSFEDQKLQQISFGGPIPFAGIVGSGYASLAGSLLLSQNGDIEVNRLNPDGTLLDSRTLSAGGDIVATVGYSERVAEMSVEAGASSYDIQHFLGVSGKYVRSTLAETYSASALAADMGYLVRSPETGLSFGASLLNLGQKMRFIDEGDPLPLAMRAGFGWILPLDRMSVPPAQALTFALDGDWLAHERQWHANLGAEYSAMRLFALRLGYQFNRDVVGITAGFGVSFAGFALDYAWAVSDALTDTHRFNFTYRFGRVTRMKREEPRRPFIESVPEGQDLKGMEGERPQSFDPPRRPRPAGRPGGGAPGWIY